MTVRTTASAFHYIVQTRELESGEGFEFDMQIIAAGS